MNKPTLDELMEKVDSRYTLVVIAAKRARILTEISNVKADKSTDKPVTIAFKEIALDKISYLRAASNV